MRSLRLAAAALLPFLLVGCAKEPDLALNSIHDPASANFRPTANAGGPYSVVVNQSLWLTGSCGSGEASSISKYEWDRDGNGTYEWSSTSTGQTTYTYTTSGNRTASFRVTANNGATATASAQITVLAPGQAVFISFSSASDLDRFTLYTASGTYSITGGALRITGTSTQSIAEAELRDFAFGNGAIEVTTRYISGATDYGYGLLFRSGSSANHYRFLIAAAGQYGIWKWTSGVAQALKDWTLSSTIVKNGTNTLKVVCQGSAISVYINGSYVTQVVDSTYSSGSVTLDVEYNGMIVDFDDLKITPAP